MSRTLARRSSATFLKTMSPSGWPCVSLKSLKWSMSAMITDSGWRKRRARRFRHPLSVIMADIVHFRLFNDTHGHPEGDIVLRKVAELLLASVRDIDFVARYGGEEFLII